MGWLRNLEISIAYRIPAPLFRWIEAVSTFLEGNGTPYTNQTAWFVSTAGSDDNDGLTLATPLKTDAEIQRRWGPRARISVPVTITYVNSPATVTNFDVQIMTGGAITFVGVATDVLTGALSAVTTLNRATQTPWDVTGAGLGAAHVGQIIEITSSATPANVGAYATIVKDLGAGKVRVSPFGKPVISLAAPFTAVPPQVGDGFVVRTYPALQLGTIYAIGGTTTAPAATPAQCLIFDKLELTGGTGVGAVEADGISVFTQRVHHNGIRWTGVARATAVVSSGGSTKGNIPSVCDAQIWNAFSLGCLVPISAASGGSILPRQDILFQACGLQFSMPSRVISFGAAYFDNTGVPISVVPGTAYLQSGAVPDWGTANATWAIRVQSGGQYVYQTKPTINAGLGVGRETVIGGIDKLYAAIPFIDTTSNAAMVLLA